VGRRDGDLSPEALDLRGLDSSGPKPLYDARLGNLEISYGGHDKAFAGRVTAAVAAIKR
jgi:hypothetical protein